MMITLLWQGIALMRLSIISPAPYAEKSPMKHLPAESLRHISLLKIRIAATWCPQPDASPELYIINPALFVVRRAAEHLHLAEVLVAHILRRLPNILRT